MFQRVTGYLDGLLFAAEAERLATEHVERQLVEHDHQRQTALLRAFPGIELTIRTFRKKEGRIPSLEEQEKDYIQWVLAEANGNQTLAAQILGIDRVSLWRKLKKYQLEM